MNLQNIIDNLPILNKVFNDDAIVVGLACDNNYLPYLLVTLNSIKQNSSSLNNYDIVVFSSNISNKDKETVSNFISANNISVRFVDIDLSSIKNYLMNNKDIPSYISESTFIRFFIPYVLCNYNKMIYLDTDVIVQNNLHELYFTNLQNNTIGAVKDSIGFILQDNKLISNYTAIVGNKIYFNAGIMLIDIVKYNRHNCKQKLLELVFNNNFILADQDALNKLFTNNNDVHYLDYSWNYPLVQIGKNYNKEPINIIHYISAIKPWDSPNRLYSFIWWQYAKNIPYYRAIKKRMINYQLNKKNTKNIIKKMYIILKYNYYLLINNIKSL